MNEKIKQRIFQVMNKTIFAEKKKVFKIKEVSLYPSEAHMVLVIKNGVDTNATEIAKQLGLTKGAISQTITRLEKKGILLKSKDPHNKNELTLSLTALGKKACKLFESTQASFIEAYEGYLVKLNSKQKEVIFHFLQHLENAIDNIELS